jgi:hypothetical protein
MILIAGFEPFELLKVINVNPSEIIARRLYKETNKSIKLIILPVDDRCLKLKNLKNYDFIFILGYGGWFRIETKTSKGKESKFAKMIKNKLKDNSFERIGNYYCDKVYQKALEQNKNTIFIHVGFFNYNKVKNVFNECLKW